jgi:hypothetical protein
MRILSTLILFILLLGIAVPMQAEFSAGDAVVTHYESRPNATNHLDNTYCITLLKDGGLGDTLSVTDKGYDDQVGFVTNEGHVSIIFKGYVPCGATICVAEIDTSNSHLVIAYTDIGILPDSLLEIQGSPLQLTVSGDQLFITYGSILPTPLEQHLFITAVNFNRSAGSTTDNWNGTATNNQTTALPDALVDGITAFRIPSPERDNGQFDGMTTPVITSSQDIYGDASKWRFSDTTGGFIFPAPYVYQCDITSHTQDLSRQEKPFNVFPNPATHTITLKNMKGVAVFYTSTGFNFKTVNVLSNEQTVNISCLPKGIYYIVSYGGVQVQTTRLVKLE